MPPFMQIVDLLTLFAFPFWLPIFFLTTEHLTAFFYQIILFSAHLLISTHLFNVNTHFIASNKPVLNLQADSNAPTVYF